eukprot:m.46609 g.46609  ORF g.46609 m.46609 type:complete len:444 (-) comp10729_c0_seq1:145-1476(-)
MSKKALPILLVNLNCELLYVINERLEAQNAPEAKAQRIRDDIARTIFDHNIVENMFTPQPLYDQTQLLTTTKFITNSSIITLNEKSLSKLFDLMMMVFKYQFVHCKYPKELLAVTLNHLDGVTELLHLSSPAQQLVDDCRQRVLDTYLPISSGEWHRIRNALSCVLQDKHTRVALFQQAKYQGRDGRFHLDRTGPVAPGCQPPGILTYGTGGEAHQTSQVIFQSKFTASLVDEVQFESRKTRGTALGENLYLAARNGKIEGVKATQSPLTEVKPETAEISPPAPKNIQPPPQHVQELQQKQEKAKNEVIVELQLIIVIVVVVCLFIVCLFFLHFFLKTALKGLELLAGLVGGKRKGDAFPLMIFKEGEGILFEDDDDDDIDADGDDELITIGQTHSVVEVDVKQKQGAKALLALFGDDDDGDSKGNKSKKVDTSDGIMDLFDL